MLVLPECSFVPESRAGLALGAFRFSVLAEVCTRETW